jgi:hypothetical protein
MLAEQRIIIACSGSLLLRPERLFEAALLNQAGAGAYLLVRDTTCRLFGYHGLMDTTGGFSLDHMFGF